MRTSWTSAPVRGTGAQCWPNGSPDQHVTSVDVDAYLTKAAAERLDVIGLRPHLMTCDATGPLRGCYDRIVSTVAVRPIPASWLAALRPGGRLVTTISGTALIITADKTDDDGAIGASRGPGRVHAHPYGSWARATSVDGDEPTVHQSGPRRLWDIVDDIRYRWLREGSPPVYGATVTITPDGACHLTRGRWQATIPQSG